ncbi:MAG TPA: phospholipase D-like domain-containing protein [Burkholderiaceae bacterium]|nr:phospholipase D-like domain-containing protein [Burkholderiaceae bacterium]
MEWLRASVTVPLALVVILAAATIVLGLALWSVKRRPKPRLRIACETPIAELAPTLSGTTHGALIEGNAVELFENEALFDAVFADIRAATRSVHFETFLWKDGVLGRRMADALAERSRSGAAVRVLVDAVGGKKMGDEAKRRLRESGCKLYLYRPRHLTRIGVVNERDHRKITVIDGRIAYVCGHCIVDNWLGNGQDRDHFRDIAIRLRGPVVHAVQSAFFENWVEESGELLIGDDVFPALQPEGDVPVHIARIKPQGSAPAVQVLHHLAITAARERILIQNPYFLPDPEAMHAFARAVERGVDVRVMVPSAEVSDMPIVQHAAHRNFDALLASGVRIYEYQTTLLHQKVMTIDGVWSAVGSTNFDDRSFEISDEITAGIYDEAIARRLEAIFERDLRDCVELELASWRKRGVWHRFKDNALYLFNEQM